MLIPERNIEVKEQYHPYTSEGIFIIPGNREITDCVPSRKYGRCVNGNREENYVLDPVQHLLVPENKGIQKQGACDTVKSYCNPDKYCL
jgi:hypothetical protein